MLAWGEVESDGAGQALQGLVYVFIFAAALGVAAAAYFGLTFTPIESAVTAIAFGCLAVLLVERQMRRRAEARLEKAVEDLSRLLSTDAQAGSVLSQRVNALKAQLSDLRQRSIQYNIYQRDADTNRELYDGLLQRYKEIGVAGAAENNNVAVVDAARLPETPSSPRLSVNLLLFTLAGAILGLIVVAVLEQLGEGAEPALSPNAPTGPPQTA